MLLSPNSHTLLFFFWITLDIRACLALYSFGFYMYERILWINFNVLGKNFVISRVSGQNINGKYCLNVCMVSLFPFCFVWLGGNAMFILILCTLHTFLSAFSYTMLYSSLCITFCQCLSRMFRYCSKLSTI